MKNKNKEEITEAQFIPKFPLQGDLGGMNQNAAPEIFRRAKELRMSTTEAEQILWERLKAGKLNGLKFRR